MGLMFLIEPEDMTGPGQSPPPPEVGWMFLIGGVVFALVILITALLLVVSGVFLGRRKHRKYCFAVAIISCLFPPLGTILGVFTIIVLSRTSVKALFSDEVSSELA